MKDTDLAWLAGFWDGEGSITLFTHQEKNGMKKICPSVSVVNTDIGMINKTRKILEGLGCNFNLSERQPKNSRHSKVYILQTRNMNHIIKFLSATTMYLSGEKRERAEILLDYCVRRAVKLERLPSKGSTPYDDQDWADLESFNSMPFRRSNNRSSQTTREALVQE